MKNKLIILALFIQSIMFGQINTFVGQTKEQVSEQFTNKSNIEWFGDVLIITKDKTNLVSSEIFFEYDECYCHSDKIRGEDIIFYESKLRTSGYIYDFQSDSWRSPNGKVSCIINTVENRVEFMRTPTDKRSVISKRFDRRELDQICLVLSDEINIDFADVVYENFKLKGSEFDYLVPVYKLYAGEDVITITNTSEIEKNVSNTLYKGGYRLQYKGIDENYDKLSDVVIRIFELN